MIELKNLSNLAICVNAYLKGESIALSHILSSANSFESSTYLSRKGSPNNGNCLLTVFLDFKKPVFLKIY